MTQLGQRVSDLVGAPLGGLLVATGGLALALLVDAVSFVAVLVAVLAVRLPRAHRDPDAGPPRGVLRELGAGLRYAGGHPVLRPLLLLMTACSLFAMPVINIGALLRVTEEGWGVGAYAAFVAVFSAGAAVGSLAVTRFRSVARPALVGTWWQAVQAVTMIGIAAAPTLPLLLTATALAGLTSGPTSAYLLGHLQAVTDEAYLGRVMSLVGFSSLGLLPVGYAVFGVLAEMSSTTTVGVCCGLLMLVPCATALVSPAVVGARSREPVSGLR